MKPASLKKSVLLSLIIIVALVQSRCLTLDFNSFWDYIHVFRNPFQANISFHLIGESFSKIVEAEYTPVRLLSNSLDYTFWRLNAFGHHLSSYLIFLLNTALVFLTLELLLSRAGWGSRRRVWVAGVTALLFGIHPLKVEVVAWVTPREYIIYSCFYLLSIIMYLKWILRRKAAWYLAAIFFALAAGFSQPLSATLPLVLLVLDGYPLRRLQKESWKRVLFDKIPFFIIAALTATKIIQVRRAVRIIQPTSLSSILAHALEFPAVVMIYLYRTVFPLFLAPIYPIEFTVSRLPILLSWLALIAFILLAVRKRKQYPALLAGLLCCLFMILPQGGLVRSGATVLADRYVYLANLPLLFGAAWITVGVLKSRILRGPTILLIGAWMIFLAWKTVTYTGLWDDPEALTHIAYDRYPRAPIIELFMLRVYNNAALEAAEKREYTKAIEQVRRALRIKPDYVDVFLTWAYILERQGKSQEAFRIYRKALKIKRDFGSVYINRGVLYGNRGYLKKAEAEFKKAIVAGGDCAEVRYNLGLLHKRWGEFAASAREFRRALAFNQKAPEVQRQLADVLRRQELELTRKARQLSNSNF